MLGAWHHFQEWILTRLIPVLQLLRLSGRPKFCHGKPLSSHTMLWCCMRHLVVSNIYTPKTLPSFDTEEEGMGIWGVCWEFFWHFVGNAFRFHDVPCVKWWFKWLVHFSLEIPMISKFQAVKRAEMFNTVHEAGVYKRWWSTWSIKFECSAWKRNTTTWTSRDLGPKKVVRKLPPPARASVSFCGKLDDVTAIQLGEISSICQLNNEEKPCFF